MAAVNKPRLWAMPLDSNLFTPATTSTNKDRERVI